MIRTIIRAGNVTYYHKSMTLASQRNIGFLNKLKQTFSFGKKEEVSPPVSSNLSSLNPTSTTTSEEPEKKLSIRERITQSGTEQQKASKEASFTELRDHLISINDYTLQNYLEDNQKALSQLQGIKGKVTSLLNQGVDKKEVETSVKMLASLSAKELKTNRVRFVSSATKLRMAGFGECKADDVNKLLKTFEANVTMWTWLRNRVEKRLPLPTTSAEMSLMFRQQAAPRMKNVKVSRTMAGGPPMRTK